MPLMTDVDTLRVIKEIHEKGNPYFSLENVPPTLVPRFYVAHIRPGAVITALHLASACGTGFNAGNCMTPVTIELPEDEQTLRIMADLIKDVDLVGHLSYHDAAG